MREIIFSYFIKRKIFPKLEIQHKSHHQTPKYTIQVKPVEWKWILEIKFYQTYLHPFFILILGNREASEISLVRVDGKTKYRMLILDSRGEDNGVAEPISLALHPASGRLFWLDKGQIFWEGHKNFEKSSNYFSVFSNKIGRLFLKLMPSHFVFFINCFYFHCNYSRLLRTPY